jgi:hypothetical protein
MFIEMEHKMNIRLRPESHLSLQFPVLETLESSGFRIKYHWAIDIGKKARSLKLVAFLPPHPCKRGSTAGANLVLVPLLQTILLCCCGIKSFLFLQNKA